MELEKYSIGICFAGKDPQGESMYRTCWRLLAARLPAELTAGAKLLGSVTEKKTLLADTGYVCVFTNLKRSRAVGIAEEVFHSPALLAEMSFHTPLIQHNRIAALDATHEAGTVDDAGTILEDPDHFFETPFRGSRHRYPHGERYSLFVAGDGSDAGAEERMRSYLAGCGEGTRYYPFDTGRKAVTPAFLRCSGARPELFETGSGETFTAAILPDGRALLDSDGGPGTEERIELVRRRGYGEVIVNEIRKPDLKLRLALSRFGPLCSGAEEVVLLTGGDDVCEGMLLENAKQFNGNIRCI